MSLKIDTFIAPVCHEQIEVLYEDEAILLINKPSGLLSLSGKNPINRDSVHYRLVKSHPSATLVHRLDFGTSGLMLVALNKAINSELTKQFQARTVTKTYIAVLYGHLTADSGRIDLPIAKDTDNFPLQKVCAVSGKVAISDYQVIERLGLSDGSPDATRVCFTPVTGRTHQLRVHSQQLGHPILGCDLYRNETSYSQASRLLLHATTLAFNHPLTGERIQWTCPAPF